MKEQLGLAPNRSKRVNQGLGSFQDPYGARRFGMVQDGVSPITAPWQLKDIIFVAFITPLVLAALLEWFLWLAAFCYCLCKVFRKAEDWSTKVLAIAMIVVFVALRGIFLPVMVVTLPLPSVITQYFPEALVSMLQWFAFWTFSILLIGPWLLCVYSLVTKSLGRSQKIKYNLDESIAPKIVIVMPVYKEEPGVLLKAINSVVDCEYPSTCIHVFLSFDGDQIDELYLQTLDRLGIPVAMKDIPVSIDVAYNRARVTVSRFPHGGKRKCQKWTFKLIEKIYTRYLQRKDDLFILFIDSDCILDKLCIQNFLYEMELKPGAPHNMIAMTGVITSTTHKQSLITLLQDMEYIHGQLFERSVESSCGAVTCLPGALTILRFSAFRNMAKYYFADKAEQCEDFFDYGKCHLGEDRWLTHLFMVATTKRYQIGMCTNAFCKTEAVQTFRSLLKQRRRWFLGFLTNEVCMITDIRLWRRYPLLCVVRFMQNTIRTTALLFFMMVLSLATTVQKVQDLPTGFIAVSLGLNYLLMLYFGIKIRRFKAWLYPLMFLLNPFFNWLYMVYGIFTAGQRTWGGPRADAGAADIVTTAQQAIEHAQATGDDLNVIPETFRPAAAARRSERRRNTTLHPSESVEGRFAPFHEVPNPGNKRGQDFVLPLPTMAHGSRAASFDSVDTIGSTDFSVHTPRLLESIISGDECWQDSRSRRTNSGQQNRHDLFERSSITNKSRLARSEPTYYSANPGELSARLAQLRPLHPSCDITRSNGQNVNVLAPLTPINQIDGATQTKGSQGHERLDTQGMGVLERQSRASAPADTPEGSGKGRKKLLKRNPSPGRIV